MARPSWRRWVSPRERDGTAGEIVVAPGDAVFVTLDSMTEAYGLGGMNTAPVLHDKSRGGARSSRKRIAAGRPAYGNPSVFADRIDQSKWVSFTTTPHDPGLLRIVRDFTGNASGERGLITVPVSAWLASIVGPYQPHFIGQPADVSVFWGYGLAIVQSGIFVGKPMTACAGREIMTEVLGHSRVSTQAARIMETSICIPRMMLFITSHFPPRAKRDRPDARVLFKAFMAMHDLHV